MIQQKLQADGKKTLITHYADLLKYICKNYFGWDGRKDDKGRQLLQHVGTDVIRKNNPTLWVDFVVMILSYFGENWDYVIIPDCRFPNEITEVSKNFDTVYIRVERPNFKNSLTPEQLMHPSETALDNFKPDYRIINNSDKNELMAKVSLWVDRCL